MGKERFARWPGMVDNRRGNTTRSGKAMQDEMTGQETLEPETMGSDAGPRDS